MMNPKVAGLVLLLSAAGGMAIGGPAVVQTYRLSNRVEEFHETYEREVADAPYTYEQLHGLSSELREMNYPILFFDRRTDQHHDIVDSLANLIERVNTDELRNEPATQAVLYAQGPEFREQQERKHFRVSLGIPALLMLGISAGCGLILVGKK